MSEEMIDETLEILRLANKMSVGESVKFEDDRHAIIAKRLWDAGFISGPEPISGWRNDGSSALIVYVGGLTYAGSEELRRREAELEAQTVSARAKRAGRFLASKLWELLLASFGSGVLGGVLGYFIRVFQEG